MVYLVDVAHRRSEIQHMSRVGSQPQPLISYGGSVTTGSRRVGTEWGGKGD